MEFQNSWIRYKIEDGVLFAWFLKDAVIDLDAAKACVNDRIKFVAGKSYPTLMLDEGVKEIKREARIFMASAESQQFVSKGAFVSTNPFTRIFIDFFMGLNNKYPFPVKVFSNEEKAISWLKK